MNSKNNKLSGLYIKRFLLIMLYYNEYRIMWQPRWKIDEKKTHNPSKQETYTIQMEWWVDYTCLLWNNIEKNMQYPLRFQNNAWYRVRLVSFELILIISHIFVFHNRVLNKFRCEKIKGCNYKFVYLSGWYLFIFFSKLKGRFWTS